MQAVGKEIVQMTASGLYCEAGDFFVDPLRPVEQAVITHGHADHARPACSAYLASDDALPILQQRLGSQAWIETLPPGETLVRNGVRVSLHPAGHMLGSCQVRIEAEGRVCVVSGDYKTRPDPTCRPFEPLRCDHFITESTFGLPIFQWRPDQEVFEEINNWWRTNQKNGVTSVLFAYAAGKAQRLLAGLEETLGPIVTHGAVERITDCYRSAGIELPGTLPVSDLEKGFDWSRSLILAPPSAGGTPWMQRFGAVSRGFASGWMTIRGIRRRRMVDRGFVLSDHADWTGLLETVAETGADKIWATHGYAGSLARYLKEQGHEARAVGSRFANNADES